uniref:Uncharacterized protein n=1 Tax=Arundo donax TaxID=35708 RepID=A0A0A8ZBY7_ARUDO
MCQIRKSNSGTIQPKATSSSGPDKALASTGLFSSSLSEHQARVSTEGTQQVLTLLKGFIDA